MRDYDDELAHYEEAAEDIYDNYDDDYEDEYEEDYEDDYEDHYGGLEGNEEYEDDEYQYVDMDYPADDYDNYKATSIGHIDSNDRTLTVTASNTSGSIQKVVVFAGNRRPVQAAGVTVSVEESSHAEVQEESKASPFLIKGMKYSVSNALQFDNVLRIIRRSAAGSSTERVYQPRNATSPQNFTQNLIDDDNFSMEVTGQDALEFDIEDGASLVFTFTIKARANIGNLLKGKNVAELSNMPRTTGLPQIDLRRKPRTRGAFGIKPKRVRPARPRRVVRRVRPARRVQGGVRPSIMPRRQRLIRKR